MNFGKDFYKLMKWIISKLCLNFIKIVFRKDFMVNKFFFTTAFFGFELKEWSKREQLLNEWRRLADLVNSY